MKPFDLFNETKARVPAYRDFLEKNNFGFSGGWEQIPFINKKNYLLEYPTREMCWDASLAGCHLIGASSGFSKSGSVFWPKRSIDEKQYLSDVEQMLESYYSISERRTLVFVCLAFGTWIGGMQIASTMRQLAALEKYELTVTTPSLNLAEAMDIYEEFSENYDQFIFMTNPSNINLLMHLFRERGIKPKPDSTYFPVVGEFFPESFRNKVNEFFGHGGDNAFTVWTGYGSADTGDVAVETAPLIRLRNYIHARPELSDNLFGTSNTPFMMKLFPKAFVEIIGERIVVTKDQMIPLVRYDTGDTGFIVKRDELKDIPTEIFAELPAEILCISGRVDNMIIFYGTNLSLEEINDYFTNLDGNYNYGGYFEVEQLQEGDADIFRFYVHIAADPTEELRDKYHRELIDFLSRRSNEFRAKYEDLSKSIGRQLIEVELRKVDPSESKKKHKYIIKG